MRREPEDQAKRGHKDRGGASSAGRVGSTPWRLQILLCSPHQAREDASQTESLTALLEGRNYTFSRLWKLRTRDS